MASDTSKYHGAGKIEVDPVMFEETGEDSYDSAGYDTSTASLASSINSYVFENGRRYHIYFGPDKNVHPTDEIEQDRLDLHHEIFIQLLDGALFKAPVNPNAQRILDIGTGTGIWAIDIADKFPSAEVTGTDISPIQPKWVPPNCRFEVDDAELDFTYRKDYFDFVHVRNLAQSIHDWPRLMKQIYKVTVPGGYVELCELGMELFSDDGTAPPSHPVAIYSEYVQKATKMMGMEAQARSADMVRYLSVLGFEDITVHTIKQPVGMWPREPRLKQIGAMMLLNVENGCEAYGVAPFTRFLGMSVEEAKKVCQDAVRAAKSRAYHVYSHYYVVYGRKPLNGSK